MTAQHDSADRVLEAERYTLACMMGAPGAVETAVEIISPADFMDPGNAAICGALVAMFADQIPVTVPTLGSWLDSNGITGYHGRDYLQALYDLPVTADMVEPHARIVWDASVRRQVSGMARNMHTLAGDPAATPDAIIGRAQDSLNALTSAALAERAGLQGISAFTGAGHVMHDPVVPGMIWKMDRIVVVGGEGDGKALATDTPIPTPKGWRTMGDLVPGDAVFAADGTPCRVTGATPVMLGRPCYRVTFSDGAEIVADASHLWPTETLAAREGRAVAAPVTTAGIAATLRARDGHAVNHAIPTCGPLAYPAQELPVAPYTLGAWLGDGIGREAAITSADPQITDEIRADGYLVRARPASPARCPTFLIAVLPGRPGSVQRRLRDLGVLGAKHIPDRYLHASPAQRLALLQGLMDTDGYVAARGDRPGRGFGRAQCEFSVTSARLAADVRELLLGLGVKVTSREGRARIGGRDCGPRYRLIFQTDLPVFRLARKAARMTPQRTRRSRLRYITACEPVTPVPVKCIEIDHPTRLYLAGRECIPTHNSWCANQVGFAAAAGRHPFTGEDIPPQRVLIVDLETAPAIFADGLSRQYDVASRCPGWDDGRIKFWHRPGGINLELPTDALLLAEQIRLARPDLVIAGPIYKMIEEGEHTDHQHRVASRFWDKMRERYGFGLWMETHPPMQGAGSVKNPRLMRPRGSGVWAQWAEMGIALLRTKVTGELELGRFRGDRGAARRCWPTHVQRSGLPLPSWPFIASAWPTGTWLTQDTL